MSFDEETVYPKGPPEDLDVVRCRRRIHELMEESQSPGKKENVSCSLSPELLAKLQELSLVFGQRELRHFLSALLKDEADRLCAELKLPNSDV